MKETYFRAMSFTAQFLTNVLEVSGELGLLTVKLKADEDGTTTVYSSRAVRV